MADSFELIEKEYVLVSRSLMDSSSSAGTSRLSNMQFRSSFSLQASGNIETRVSEPVLTVGSATNRIGPVGRLESSSFAPGASQGSTDIVDPLEQPTDGMARIGSLQQFASAITDLVNEKVTHVDGVFPLKMWVVLYLIKLVTWFYSSVYFIMNPQFFFS